MRKDFRASLLWWKSSLRSESSLCFWCNPWSESNTIGCLRCWCEIPSRRLSVEQWGLLLLPYIWADRIRQNIYSFGWLQDWKLSKCRNITESHQPHLQLYWLSQRPADKGQKFSSLALLLRYLRSQLSLKNSAKTKLGARSHGQQEQTRWEGDIFCWWTHVRLSFTHLPSLRQPDRSQQHILEITRYLPNISWEEHCRHHAYSDILPCRFG